MEDLAKVQVSGLFFFMDALCGASTVALRHDMEYLYQKRNDKKMVDIVNYLPTSVPKFRELFLPYYLVLSLNLNLRRVFYSDE